MKMMLSSKGRRLPCYVRLMRKEDISQVNEIDREAFPTLWPPTNYQHEMQNRLAHYIVACREGEKIEEPMRQSPPQQSSAGLKARVRHWLRRDHSPSIKSTPSRLEYVTGFVGFWIMADEAHITNIAVREINRRQGTGEQLLIAALDLARELDASFATLEVRVSNTAAQSLYAKYGFTQTGLRRGYYTDNREDAAIMSTENFTSASFQTHLQQLKQDYSRRWGIALGQTVH